MESFQGILLEVWREACRHIEIEESAATIEHLLGRHLPLLRLVVVVFDWSAATVTIRTEAPGGDRGYRDRTRHPADLRALRAWAESDTLITVTAGATPGEIPGLLLPDHAATAGAWLMIPLQNERRPSGALLLELRPDADPDPRQRDIVLALREPFAAAIENDRRLHELNALREAAEADKRSALSRLGRVELGDTIIGAEQGLGAVMERVHRIAKSDIPVLILGETGTGKEVIARTIHDHSQRSRGPFIRVNCGAIPPELIDSELFGHEKGAFTGAMTTRRGWFERADNGTLLLDEIGELSLAAQVRLLRVLQEGTFERVGGEQQRHVDVRIIAATHRDLPAMVQHRQFREDLWYRIAGFPIVLPPLRERLADIPALARHFAERAARRFGLRSQLPTRRDLDLLATYNWPGNIREFQSVIDRAAILGDGQQLEIARALGAAPAGVVVSAQAATRLPETTARGGATLNEAMRAHIEQALCAAQGRIEGERGAARLLCINPHTLRARMRRLGIEWQRFRM